MAANSELTDHALSSSEDFYALLGISAAAQEGEIRRAYRQTALKYHPDKVGNDQAKLDKFHLLQIAYDVLSDSTARQVYDNARRAKEEKKSRESAYDDRRRHLKEELERREKAGVAGLKRKYEADDAEEIFQQTIQALAADGKRRRKEREEQLRREAEELRRDDQRATAQSTHQQAEVVSQPPDEFDRTVKARYAADDPDAESIDSAAVIAHFSRFGKVEHVMLKSKKIKEEGQKHRREFTVAFVVFASVVGAHAAVTDFLDLHASALKDPYEASTWKVYKEVSWAGGKEPECIPKPRASSVTDDVQADIPSLPATPKAPRDPDGLRKVPSFSSFKGTPKAASSPSMEEITMIRLKNAERRRLAEKIRRDEEAQA